jgi:hypothetical protein
MFPQSLEVKAGNAEYAEVLRDVSLVPTSIGRDSIYMKPRRFLSNLRTAHSNHVAVGAVQSSYIQHHRTPEKSPFTLEPHSLTQFSPSEGMTRY